jgi:hypothetical protein
MNQTIADFVCRVLSWSGVPGTGALAHEEGEGRGEGADWASCLKTCTIVRANTPRLFPSKLIIYATCDRSYKHNPPSLPRAVLPKTVTHQITSFLLSVLPKSPLVM